MQKATPSPLPRSQNDIVIVATGSLTPTGRNPEEAHRAAIDFRTGIRELAPSDVAHFDLLCEVKGLTTDKDKQELFRCLWGNKCGVGGVIPAGFFPSVESGFYPRTFHKKGEPIVGIPVLQAFVAFAQVREKLAALFSNGGRVRGDLAPETMIDIANGAGSSVEMVEQALMDLYRAKVDERIGISYGRGKWLLGMLGSMIAGHIASQAGVEGPQSSSNSACASSGLSMFHAWNAIRAGSAEIGIVGGSECATGAITTYVAFDHMMLKCGALTREWRGNRLPGEALLSFDQLR
ncbi:MAG: beta-ketoacyl synthase N-terminal-like domain-containing protein, partial [Candidatus Peribacteraceae bacterium]|nr:beta-ketoacyl synthase N-terminal-like domain-containing protein [Candidatus Peribacteraceae bacterium]